MFVVGVTGSIFSLILEMKILKMIETRKLCEVNEQEG